MSDRTTTQRVDDMSCDEIAAHAVAERYLLAELSEPDRDAYERHYFSCERCFHELTILGAVRTELSAAGLPAIGSSPDPRRIWWPAWLGAAAVIALGVGLWTMRPVRQAGPAPATGAIDSVETPQATVAATPPPPRPVEPAVTLAALARFEPPPYKAPVLRGPEDEARKLFQAAMTHYTAGAHDRAIQGLRSATGRDPRASDAGFFLGVSLLLTGQSQAGITELRRTIALGDSPYLEEAHFYLAKGLLQVADVSGARRELRAMVALGGDHQREGTQLLSQVESEAIRRLIKEGRYPEAEAGSRSLLARVQASSDRESLETAEVVDLLVESLWQGGRFTNQEGRRLAEQAVAIKEKLGAAEPSLAKSLLHLAAWYSASGDHAAAKPLYERTLAMQERALGPNHPVVAFTLNVFGASRTAAGDYQEARRLLERGLVIRESVLGRDHLDVAASLMNLAVVLERTGDRIPAKALVERAIAIREKQLPPGHPRR